ncbi:MAG: hypothetical protein JWP97_1872 [Labilithrix sp.]|nr:hypothetical protein [Labilithrix sp.]
MTTSARASGRAGERVARAIGLTAGFVTGLVAVYLLDLLDLGSFVQRPWAPGVAGGAVAFGAAALWPALLGHRPGPGRVGATTLLVGSLCFVAGRAPFGWLDLGPLGAGGPGQIPLVILPLSGFLAVLAAWPEEARGVRD